MRAKSLAMLRKAGELSAIRTLVSLTPVVASAILRAIDSGNLAAPAGCLAGDTPRILRMAAISPMAEAIPSVARATCDRLVVVCSIPGATEIALTLICSAAAAVLWKTKFISDHVGWGTKPLGIRAN
jgi:hypothetical protein